LINNLANGHYYVFYLDGCSHTIIDGLEGASKIEGYSIGVYLDGCDNVTVRDYWIMGFHTGIDMSESDNCIIKTNHFRDNTLAISIKNTLRTTIHHNIFTGNSLSIRINENSFSNKVYFNLFFESRSYIRIEGDPDDNEWYNHDLLLGNHWSTYWGHDEDGDGVGDTPYLGLDLYPLVDPSIPMEYGQLPIGDDWWQASTWLVWRGGWSPVEIQMTDSEGRVINSTVNEIGLNAWYYEETQPDGTKNVVIIIVAPPFNPHPVQLYSFEMTALDDLTYWMDWFVSYGDAEQGIGGEVLFEREVEEASLTAGQTRLVETKLEMTPDGVVVEAVAQYDFSGFLRPIKEGGKNRFLQGMSIPIKFQLSDDNGEPVSTAHAVLELAPVIDGAVDKDDYMPANSTGAANNGNVFRYDPLKEQYIFNLDTMELAPGTYRLRITLDDGQVFEVDITLV
jgi:parallel beta-helix repeat protein